MVILRIFILVLLVTTRLVFAENAIKESAATETNTKFSVNTELGVNAPAPEKPVVVEKSSESDADTVETHTVKSTSERLASTSSWPLVILTLIGVIGFIFVLAWLAKRFGGMSAMGGRDLKVIAALPVGAKERVAVIDVKGQQFLIGITSHNISRLHAFDEPVVSTNSPGESEFASKLSRLLKAEKGAEHEGS